MESSKPSANGVGFFVHDRSRSGAILMECPRCQGSLDVHQPDSELSTRLLATCGDCKTWYVLLQHDQRSSLIALVTSRSKPKGFRLLKRRGTDCGHPALLMKTALPRSGTPENHLEREGRCAGSCPGSPRLRENPDCPIAS
jgi:hypothetical protein